VLTVDFAIKARHARGFLAATCACRCPRAAVACAIDGSGSATRMQTSTIRAYAKLNLSLEVLGRRVDGFHRLETVFQTIALHDEISLGHDPRGRGISLTCDQPEVPADATNLAWRAAAAFVGGREAQAGAIALQLRKGIPHGPVWVEDRATRRPRCVCSPSGCPVGMTRPRFMPSPHNSAPTCLSFWWGGLRSGRNAARCSRLWAMFRRRPSPC